MAELTAGPAVAVGIGACRSGIVMSVLGAAWWAEAVATLPVARMLPMLTLCLLLTIALLTACRHRLHDGDAPPSTTRVAGLRRNTYLRVNVLQGLAIPLVALTAGATGHPALIAPLVAGIVGAHFLPLGKAYHWRGYEIQGWALLTTCALGLCLVLAGASAATARSAAGFGACAVVWGGVGALLVTAARTKRRNT